MASEKLFKLLENRALYSAMRRWIEVIYSEEKSIYLTETEEDVTVPEPGDSLEISIQRPNWDFRLIKLFSIVNPLVSKIEESQWKCFAAWKRFWMEQRLQEMIELREKINEIEEDTISEMEDPPMESSGLS